MSSRDLTMHFGLMPPLAYDKAPLIEVIDGEIVLVGPGALAFSMTREAAEEMQRRLAEVLAAPIA